MKHVSVAILVCGFFGQAYSEGIGADPRLEVKIITKSGKIAEIKGPQVSAGTDDDFKYVWSNPDIQPNRDRMFTAVHYFGSMSKYWNALVYLIRPDGRVQRLKQDTVLKIQWTEDGHYLIGFGGNTLRLWNLNGGLRQVSFQDIRAAAYRDGRICLNLNWYSPTTGQLSRSVERQLAVPSLNQVVELETNGEETCQTP